MTDGSGSSPGPWRGPRLSVVVGLGRPQESRLLDAIRQDAGLRVVRRCSSAPELLEVLRPQLADIVLLDEDLHLLSDDALAELDSHRVPTVVLTRRPDATRWQNLRMHSLGIDAEAAGVADALRQVFRGDRPGQARASRATSAVISSDTSPECELRPRNLQVLAFWSGPGSPGRTTVAINCAALLGSTARTVLVDLDLTGAAVAAQLDGSGRTDDVHVRLVPNIAQLALAAPESRDALTVELSRLLQPLGSLSPQAVALAGIPRPALRRAMTAALAERMIAALRSMYDFVLLDLGDEPVSDDGREAAVTRAALRAADYVLVVCPPDGPGIHRTRAALSDAGDALVGTRTGLVVNRYDRRFQSAELDRLEVALDLPVLCVLPVDHAAVQKALAEGRPVVYDSRSKLRRPLLDLAERIWGGQLTAGTRAGTGFVRPWTRLQAALFGLGVRGAASR